ncbi:hypothetical protein [Coleofasciculus sp.]|uniref:hypothetical protein n=1 Tax=Coleofasciculus sp. TaxID=3100458 RepID=UPI0039F83658
MEDPFISREGTKPQVERLVKEVTTHLASELESELLNWQRDQLQPLVSSRLEDFLKELNDGAASEFIKQVDDLKLQISGGTVSIDDVGPRKVGVMERVLAAAGGLLIGIGLLDFGLAGIGAVFGYQEMAKAIIPGSSVVSVLNC